MRIFNLAEELEKERKKNKELKEILNYYKNDNEKYEKSVLNQFNKEQLETTFHKNYQRYKNHKVLLDYINNLQDRIDKAINILELSSQNKGICTRPETDTIQSTLLILKGSDNNE